MQKQKPGNDVSEHELAQRRRALRELPERKRAINKQLLIKAERILESSAIKNELATLIEELYEDRFRSQYE